MLRYQAKTLDRQTKTQDNRPMVSGSRPTIRRPSASLWPGLPEVSIMELHDAHVVFYYEWLDAMAWNDSSHAMRQAENAWEDNGCAWLGAGC